MPTSCNKYICLVLKAKHKNNTPEIVAVDALITTAFIFLATFFTIKFCIDWIKIAVKRNIAPRKKSVFPSLFELFITNISEPIIANNPPI